MNKIYTSKEQSEKLIELGLDINTADMYYPNRTDINYQGALPIEYKHGNSLLSQEIPCWSFPALLDLLPNHIEVDRCITFLDIYKTRNYGWVIEYSDNKEDVVKYSFDGNILIDVCYEMIIKLKEQKLL